MGRIIKSTLAEQVYTDLSERILSGELPAGHRLFPEMLAATLAISPTPVKEALLRLQADGLVVAESRRGVVVRRFSPGDTQQLCEARGVLERAAVQTGFARQRVDAALVAALEAIFTRQVSALTRGELARGLTLDRVFHFRIVGLADNPLMSQWHQQVMVQTHTIRVYAAGAYALDRMRREHRAIIDAFAAGDEIAVLAALELHLAKSRDDLLERLTPVEG